MSKFNTNQDRQEGFIPVSITNPCPVCKKPDWCLIATDGTAAICPRTKTGSAKRCGDAGWLHRMAERPQYRDTPKPRKKQYSCIDWQAEAQRFAAMLTDAYREWIHSRLGLPLGILDAIPLIGSPGTNTYGPIITWPEVDATGTVVGITDRIPGAAKDSKKMRAGGKRGLTLPVGWFGRSGPVFVVEGPTDAAALTAAGLPAIGRPSKDGGENSCSNSSPLYRKAAKL